MKIAQNNSKSKGKLIREAPKQIEVTGEEYKEILEKKSIVGYSIWKGVFFKHTTKIRCQQKDAIIPTTPEVINSIADFNLSDIINFSTKGAPAKIK